MEFKIRAAIGDPRGDLKVWEWLRALLEWLGTYGMSSDDTDIERMERIYRVKILLWRRTTDKYLDLIDNDRYIPDDKFARQQDRSLFDDDAYDTKKI